MRQQIVLTATGRDRPGVVERMTEQIAAVRGNVESSRMARLGGEFAMVMLISLDDSSFEDLETKAESLRNEGFDVRLRTTETSDARSDATSACSVTVTGADHQGIIHQIARQLAERQINIETMDTNVYQAPMSGVPLLTMAAVVHLPTDVSSAWLAEAMETLGHELGVEIRVSHART
jgi:glycine cleavage system transcriptional repressor